MKFEEIINNNMKNSYKYLYIIKKTKIKINLD